MNAVSLHYLSKYIGGLIVLEELKQKKLILESGKETWSDSSILLIWNKLCDGPTDTRYEIYSKDQKIGETCFTDFTVEQLEPDKNYMFHIIAFAVSGELVISNAVEVTTAHEPENIDITTYGAVGDGKSLNTKAIQKAIDDCPQLGRVIIPEGIFVSGALYLKSNMTLYVKEGGRLLGSSSLKDFPVIKYRFEGLETDCYASLINTVRDGSYENITIAGKGVIDANGSILRKLQTQHLQGKPGRAICLIHVNGIYFKDITIRQSPSWCVHTIYCSNITLNQISIHVKYDEEGKRYEGIENGDGFDPDSCKNVNVVHSMIASQDDSIAIKSGKDEEGRQVGIACENIRVSNCRFVEGFGVAVGSEMSGSVRNVLVQDCTCENTYFAVSLKSPRGRGGIIENIKYENITQYYHIKEFQDCRWFRGAINIDMFYSHDKIVTDEKIPRTEKTPCIRNVLIKNISVDTFAGNAIFLYGLPEQYLENITLDHITATAKNGMKVNNINDLVMKDIVIHEEPST